MPAKTPASQSARATTERASTAKGRKLKPSQYSSFKLQRRLKQPAPSVKSGFVIFREACALLSDNWKLFGGIVLIYGILQMLLVQGFSMIQDVSSIKSNVELFVEGNAGQLASSLTSFGYLLGTAGAGGAYQTIVVLIVSLALIWAIRQVSTGKVPRVREAFYEGMYPLVPFVLVLAVVILQTLPVAIITSLFSYAVANGLVAQGIEYLLWALLTIMAVILSLYMLCSSLFALYIVTLPGMTPLRALRSARELVRFRRWTVMRRIVYLPLILILLAAVIMVPLIMIATTLAGYVFILLSLAGIVIIHSYMYRLYKELLG